MGRREITTTITMLVLLAILGVAGYWGWQSLFAETPEETSADPGSSCNSELLRAGDKLQSDQVRVSVYNAGTRAGLADTTASALQRRGFRIKDIGNAPSDSRVDRVQVRAKKRSDVAARLVADQFGSQMPVRISQTNLGPGVDVVVGNRYKQLVPAATRSVRVGKAQEVCVP